MTATTATATDSIQHYVGKIKKFEGLSFEHEQNLARAYRHTNDASAANNLINAHLRLVVKVAMSFKGYGLPTSEVIQEGNVGLMQAVKRFDPDKGYRLSTYAVWWIRACIQEYVLNSWSLVKVGTTASQKKLFFNLRKLRNQFENTYGENLTQDTIEAIAKELSVKEQDVAFMNQRLATGDQSLNVKLGGEENGGEWQDFLVEESDNQETVYAEKEELNIRREALHQAMDMLDPRERSIITRRRLADEDHTPTLEELSIEYGVSRERVRQLESRALRKLQKFMTAA